MNTTEKAITQMESWAADSSHGYDQSNRWGPDYDCSSAVISAWELAGVPVKTCGAGYTGNMRSVFLRCGFEDVTGSVDLGSGAGLRRGDVLLNDRHHTAMYCGSGMEVEASINENGGVTGGQTGDQTGGEFLKRPYRNYPWDCVLRYGGDTKAQEYLRPRWEYSVKLGLLRLGVEDEQVHSVQELLSARGYYEGETDGIFGELTGKAVMDYQADAGIDVDGEVGGDTWTALIRENCLCRRR